MAYFSLFFVHYFTLYEFCSRVTTIKCKIPIWNTLYLLLKNGIFGTFDFPNNTFYVCKNIYVKTGNKKSCNKIRYIKFTYLFSVNSLVSYSPTNLP